ncbi:hypothetical protein GBA52_006521 [Prunus armeniaca]|nr:hypothetical protein GBA52_006521 [Prunus armeniaca]
MVPPRQHHRHCHKLLPSNLAQSNDNGGWCNPPLQHFDLAEPAFLQIAQYRAGIVPISFRRRIRFTINGHSYFNLVLITNVGGAGMCTLFQSRGPKQGGKPCQGTGARTGRVTLTSMARLLSFQVTTSDGRTVTSNAVPADWQFGQTFSGSQF